MDYQQDISMTSSPVDPDNPGFDSLLGALKAVHEGEMEMEGLRKYHVGLQSQLNNSRDFIANMEIHDETRQTRDMALGALGITQLMLDLLQKYIDDPNPNTLAACVQSLLDSRAAMANIHYLLDKNIKDSGIEVE